MQPTAFEQLVLDVIENLPAQFARYLTNVDILVEPHCTAQHRAELELEPDDVVYGYYEGVPITERVAGELVPPDVIVIFQDSLEADFPDPAELRAEVRRTVLHELAHMFGISDDRLEELGAY
jgi:predicted Zn-dependent protease with MMP-like domain